MLRPSRFEPDIFWYLVAVTLTISGAVLVAAGAYSVVLGAGLLVLVTIVLVVRPLRKLALPAFGFVAFMSASAEFLPDESTWQGAAFRVCGLAVVVFLGASGVAASHGLAHSWFARFVVPLFLFVGASTLPQQDLGDFIFQALSLLLLTALIFALPRLDSNTLRSGAIAALAFVVGLSLCLGLINPGSALEQGRLRGFFENANTLGFFAFLLGSLMVLGVGSRWVRLLLLVMAVATVAWTGSRASALSLSVVAVIYLVSKKPTRGILIVGLLLTMTIVGAVLSPEFRAVLELLLRQNNSRASSWDVAVSALAENPIWGVGSDGAFAASSVLGSAATGGIVGLVLILALWAGILILSYRQGRRVFIFTIAAAVHSVFEAWLLSPLSPMLLMFVVCWWVTLYVERDDPRVLFQSVGRSSRATLVRASPVRSLPRASR